MKTSNFTILFFVCLAAFFRVSSLNGQSYPLDWSYANMGNDFISPDVLISDEITGDIYQVATTPSTDIVTTDGSSNPVSDIKIMVSKYTRNGTLIYRTYIGGNGVNSLPKAVAQNGLLYLTFYTSSTDLPVTDGSSINGGNDTAMVGLDPSGNKFFVGYIGGSTSVSGNPATQAYGISLGENRVMIVGLTNMTDLSVTNTSTFAGGSRDGFISTYDLGFNLLGTSYVGGSGSDIIRHVRRKDGKYFLGGTTFSGTDFPVTTGPAYAGANEMFFAILDDNLNVTAATFIGSTRSENIDDMEVDDSYLYFVGTMPQNGFNFPSTTGSSTPLGGTDRNIYIGKLNHDLSINYAHNYNYVFRQDSPKLAIENGNAYVVFNTRGNSLPYSHNAPQATATLGDVYAMKINTLNTIEYTTHLGGNDGEFSFDFDVQNNELFVVINSKSPDEITTDGSSLKGASDVLFYQLAASGTDKQVRYIGGNLEDYSPRISVSHCDMILSFSHEYDNSLTTTYNSGNAPTFGGAHEIIQKLDLNPEFPLTNDISPLEQHPCLNGFVETLVGNIVTSPDGTYQARYQWQLFDSPSGTWIDIPGAILKDYVPPTHTEIKQYRRRVYDNTSCDDVLLSTSSTAVVYGSSLVSATIDAGGVIYACPNDPVILGALDGLPTATGVEPLSYQWDMVSSLNLGGSTSPNPIATVSETTIFTLQVTDGNLCVNYDQVIVNIPTVDAGPDIDICNGIGKQIGTPGAPASSNITYSWSPIDGLSCPTCAQTLATPTEETTYTLTVEIPLQDNSGTCTLTDLVVVTPISEPVPNFAGPDKTVCFVESTDLGLPAVAGYEYVWAPGSYLYANDVAQTTFHSGDVYPQPNPYTYYLTAINGDCTFYDEVTVTMINRSDAGDDGCGPRTLGIPDETPNVNETYTWTVIEPLGHPGVFLSPTDQPTVEVGDSPVDTPIRYQLSVCYNGVCCDSDVLVPPCGGCGVEIFINNNEAGCPSYNFGETTLTAVGLIDGVPLGDYTFSWTPQEGLDNYDTQVVTLTDNVERTYTVTLTSTIDPSVSCFETIDVNGPWSLPVFDPEDQYICPGESVNIGDVFVNGYEYNWIGSGGFNSISSNPLVTPSFSSTYHVTVTDTGSGCMTTEQVDVIVVDVVADAGPDRTTCSDAVITIGSPDPSGGVWQYEWSPIVTWQGGTNQNSPQPQILVASNSLDLFLTVTDPLSGCVVTDQVTITGTDSPPFLLPLTNQSMCLGDSVVIGHPPNSDYYYEWSNSSGTGAGLSCTDCAQPKVSPTSNETYTLIVRYGEFCSASTSMNVNVIVNPLPTFDLGADLTYCPNQGGVQINGPVGMSSYIWTPDAFLNDATIQNPISTAPLQTTYTLEVTDDNGCTASDDIRVSPSAGPNAGLDKSVCLNTSAFIGDPSNTGDISWVPAIANLSCTDCPNPEFTPNESGVFVFTISSTDDSGCKQNDQVTITVPSINLPDIAAPDPICQNSCTQILFDTEPNYSYVWSPNIGLDDYTSPHPTICLEETQSYTLTVINNDSGCYDEIDLTIAVILESAPEVAIDDIEVCEYVPAQLNPTITPSANHYKYSWTPSIGLNDPNIANPTVVTYPAGTKHYTLQVTDTISGCYTFVDVDVVVKNCITLSGMVWIDANGNITMDSNEAATNAGGLYVFLTHPITGVIIDKKVLGANGHYLFYVDENSSYKIVLSELDASIGNMTPSPDLPGYYYNTGENVDGITEITNLGEIDAITLL